MTNFFQSPEICSLKATSDITVFTVPFNNVRTLKFKAQLTSAFFATFNQMFGGSSQLPTTVSLSELCSAI